LLLDKRRSGEAASDEQNWVRLGGAGRYEDYLKSCGAICAYRALAESYLSRPSVKSDRPARDPATRVGGPFSLTTSDSKKLTDRDLKGSPFLVFFGFSQCPDICPTTLMQISHLLYSTEAKGSKIKALFITVDPENDKPNVMKPFLEGFNPNIVGLTGNRTAIEATIKSYRAYARKIYLKTGGYTWDHTTTVYLMDKEGDFVRALDLEQDAAVLIQKILALI
ncbi:SCO family protein, partial [Bosea sp. FBZP-16]|uniref:SCO family protein n=1 Tax=Bosea sp. FBZP-16 TaxID=2065382 RepID=UPI0018F86753